MSWVMRIEWLLLMWGLRRIELWLWRASSVGVHLVIWLLLVLLVWLLLVVLQLLVLRMRLMTLGSDAGLPKDRHEVMVERKGIDLRGMEHGEVIVPAETAAVDAGGRWESGTAAEIVEAVVRGVDAAGDVALKGVVAEAEAVGDDDGVSAVAGAVAAVVFEAFVVRLTWNAGPCWAIGRDENPNGRVF
ncbi:hypothetical protein BGX38DRAFT_770122 [Terfezia claveryi]|nr:hypothetical protein BGX38DRAFT_770122 [Terfezia claveryi]